MLSPKFTLLLKFETGCHTDILAKSSLSTTECQYLFIFSFLFSNFRMICRREKWRGIVRRLHCESSLY